MFARLSQDEEAFFKQKSRVQWLQLGDKNTAFFHKSIIHRQCRNSITRLKDADGRLIMDPQAIGNMAVTHFKNILSSPSSAHIQYISQCFPKRMSEEASNHAGRPITKEEIKEALFSISDGKAPGPDGFTASFFKQAWDLINHDFTNAVLYFFSTGNLLRGFNATRLALIPKSEAPESLNDYRPISCCNVVYKCIAKVIAGRLKASLAEVVGPSQTAFLPGRQIVDAVLLTQELLHNYHKKGSGPPRCALKVDLRKAFDTVDWNFILEGLAAVGIPPNMCGWIRTCLSTASFSISLNGELHGFFRSSRGIRQGDPMSPYLFAIAMEGLNGILSKARDNANFHFHWRCKRNAITHICFADDLMLFCRGDEGSLGVLKESLDRFANLSGLNINHSKSSIFLAGLSDQLQASLANCMGFSIQTPPVRYLGLPLITTRLTHSDCQPLIDRILSRIKLWTSASLTFAGRLQLIKAVLFSIQVYWSSSLMLPCSVIKKIERTMAAFLWKGVTLSPYGAKVAWSSVCFPTNEGGLGVKRLHIWNKAAITKLL